MKKKTEQHGIAVPLKKLAVAVSTLHPDPENAREHGPESVDALRTSLERFGQRKPIVVQRRGMVVRAGNGLLEAATALGWTHVAAIVLDDTDDMALAYAAADNRTAELSRWNPEMLAKLMARIPEDARTATGFTEREIARMLLTQSGPVDAEPQLDKADELNRRWKVKRGDLWLIGEHKLLCGDSTKAEDVGRLLGENEPSMILADPPYFGKVDEAWDNDFEGYEHFLDFLDSVFALWIPKTMDRGTSAWWCAPDFAWHIEERLRKYAAVFNHIVWMKGKSLGTTVSVKDMRRWRPRSERLLLCEKQHSPDALLASFNAKTAHIAARSAYTSIIDRLEGWHKKSGLTFGEIDKCLGTNGMAGHYFGRSQWSLPTKENWDKLRPLFKKSGVDIGNWDAQRAEFDAQRAEFDAQRREFDAQRREFDAQRREFDAETADNLTDVWEMSAPTGDERPDHPTPKPLPLIAKLISAHTRHEDLVADPFLGSGTTMVAAQNLGRKCRGIEVSPAYCAVILERMKTAFPGIKIEKVK